MKIERIHDSLAVGIELFIEAADALTTYEHWAGRNYMDQKVEDLGASLLAYTDFFGQNRISCQCLVDVLIPTYLKLAQQLNPLTRRSPSATNLPALELLYCAWAVSLLGAVGVKGFLDSNDCLSLEKRMEMQRTIFNAPGMPAVSMFTSRIFKLQISWLFDKNFQA